MDVLRRLLEIVDGGEVAVLATVVSVSGSAPRSPGARMLLSASGERVGTVGGGEVETAALPLAEEMLAGGPSVRGLELPVHCGGRVTLMLEKFAPTRRLLVIGAGHVGRALAAAASNAGYRVTVVSPSGKEDMSDAGVEAVAAADPAFLGEWGEPARTHVIVATGASDTPWAVAALQRPFAGVGVIGSRNKAATIRHAAAAAGVTPERIHQLRCPVGLDLGAVTPEEIAVSVVAELVRLDRTGEVPAEWRRASQG
jgi:xanthine dehydrogenase accessory factor